MPSRSPRAVARIVALVAITLAATGSLPAADDWVVAAPEAEAARPEAAEASRFDLGANFEANLDVEAGLVLRGPKQIRAGGLSLTLEDGGMVQFGDGDGGLTLVGGPVPKAGPGKPAEPAAVAALREAAADRISRLEETVRLSADERRKLELAMQSDVTRVANEIAVVRRRYEGVEVGLGDAASEKTLQRYREDLARCRRTLRDPLGEGSLFSKVLAGLGKTAAGR